MMRFVPAAAAAGVLALLGVVGPLDSAINAQAPQLSIATLSGRPDMVSGGDALIEIRGAGTSAAGLSVIVNGRPVTSTFSPSTDRGSLTGIVEGLREGPNTIEVRAGGRSARLEVRNHPKTGPVFSGPHLTPFVCRTEESGLGAPLDANCTATTKVDYFYKSTATPPPAPAGPGGAAARPSPFKPWPLDGPRPTDIAEAAITTGEKVPFIVRVESGTINRAIYRIAILDDPPSSAGAAAPGSWRPGRGWNRRFLFSFGGGCGTNYDQGDNQVTAALDDSALSGGFAYAISTQNVMGQHCNDALSGEALMMIKEHFVERYGLPVWTVGRGGSGGAIQQLLIAQNYPGLLDGIMPSLSFADSLSLRPGVADCRLLITYYKAHPDALTDAQKTAVEGYTPGTCAAWDRGLVNVIVADHVQGCGIPADMVYHPTKNPKGARCTLWDTNVNSFGRDPETGFARRSYDNVGIQYGLEALNDGVITKAQFLDLNEHVGGFDNDGHPRPAQRTEADLDAVRLAYATGRVNSGAGGLGSLPILQYRSYNDPRGDIHDRFRDFSIRDRIRRTFGRTDNQVIWIYGAANAAGAPVATQALETMTRWLDALVKDTSSAPAIDKVVRAKPADAVDGCWDDKGQRINELASFNGEGRCNQLYPNHTNPRLMAGAPLSDDVLKCELKPIAAGDYKLPFTGEEMTRLRAIFPNGVCDYSKPGVNKVPLAGTYLRLPLPGM